MSDDRLFDCFGFFDGDAGSKTPAVSLKPVGK